MKTAGTILSLVLGVIVIVVALILFRGYVLSYLWLWFLVPIGIPPIGVANSIGISMLTAMLTKEISSDAFNKDKESHGFEKLAAGIVATLLVWGMGWFIHHFFM